MQYGIRLTDDDLPWGEFIALLAGIMPETPLGQVVSIRAEEDPEIIKCFNDEQRRIRDEWHSKKAQKISAENYVPPLSAPRSRPLPQVRRRS